MFCMNMIRLNYIRRGGRTRFRPDRPDSRRAVTAANAAMDAEYFAQQHTFELVVLRKKIRSHDFGHDCDVMPAARIFVS